MNFTSKVSSCFISPNFGAYNLTALPVHVVHVWTTLAWLNGIAAPITAIINTIIIWTISSTQELRQKPYFNLLMALASADLTVGLVAEPLACWYVFSLLENSTVQCLHFACALISIICSGTTLNILLVASVERYFSVQYPFFHRSHISNSIVAKATFFVCATTTSAFIILRILLANFIATRFILVLNFLIGHMIVILYCNIKVYITAFFKKTNTVLVSQPTDQQEQEQSIRKEDIKRAVSTSIIVMTNLIGYVAVIIILSAWGAASKDFEYIGIVVGMTLIHIQSLINPLIVTLRIVKIRQAIKHKLMSCFN